MTCCNSILSLGCSYSCDTIQIGINAPATGVYTIELQPDSIKVVSTTNTIATPLIFSGGYLNEDAVHVFKIIKPDGSYLEVNGSECFQIDIKPTTNATLADTDIEPISCDDATAVLKNSTNTTINTTEIASGATANITAPDGTAILKDTDNATLSTTLIPSNTSANITAPNGGITLQNSAGTILGLTSVKSGGALAIVEADATAVLKNSTGGVIDTEAIPAGASEDITVADVAWTDSDGSAEATPYGNAITCTAQIKALELLFGFDSGDDTSALATNTGTTWTLASLAQDGSSGTITVSVNGAAYATFVNPTTITNGQTVRVKRTSTGSAGSVTITGTYA